MKKYLLKATALIASLTVVSMSMPMSVGAMAAKGNNLLEASHDPGFEELTTITNTSYWNFSGGSSKSVISTDKSHTGSKSVKIVSGSQKYEGPQVKLNDLEVGSQYYVSAWVYTPTNQKAQLSLQGSGSAISTTLVPLTANRWNQVSGMVTVPAIATGSVDYEHRLYVQTEGTRSTDIYVDDFEICQTTSTTPEVPVGGNLVSNAGFETAEDSEDKVGWRNASGNTAYTRVNSMVDANTGNYVAKSVQRGNYYTGPQQYVTVEPDTYYYVRAMVRQGSNPEKEVKAKMRIAQTGSSTTFKEYNLEDDIDCNEYTPIKGVVYSGGATELRVYVQTNESSDFVDLWFDDYVLLPITSSVAKGATGITPNTNITLSVPEEIDVNTTTLTINNGATITNIARDGRTCVVSFSGMGYDTEYTLKLDTVLNTDPTWEFKTESKNLIATYDPGFEGEIDTTKWNLSKSTDGGVTRVNTRKKSGSYSAHAYGRDKGYRGPQAKDVAIVSDSKYYASAWVYTDASGMTANMNLEGDSSARTTAVSLTSGDWTKVEGMVTAVGTSARLYVETSGTADIYVDDFELYKASEVIVFSPLNGVTDAAVDSDLTLVFSDEVNLSAANLTINGGAITGDILTSDNITYTVDLGMLDDFTDYTINIKGVFDANYDRLEDSKVTFTTSSATPGAVRNMLGSYDAGFENGAISTAKWNLSGTVERAEGEGHDSSYSAKSTTHNTWSGPQAKFTNLTEGDQYYVSAWVRTAQDGQTAQLYLQGASSAKTTNVNLTANEWKQLSGIVTVPAPDVSTTNYDYRLYVNTGERTEDIYVDDFFMTPYAPTTLTSSTPANEASAVSLRETISLTFSNTLDESQTLVDKFTVSGMTVTGAALQADKKTVVLTLNSILDEYTPYTVTASGLTDQFGETVANVSIGFTTGGCLTVTQNAAFTRGGAPLTALTVGTVDIAATVTNDGSQPVAKPVMIVTVYNAAGYLIDVVATEFGESLAGDTSAPLTKSLTVDANAHSVSVHIWTAANNISYMASPEVLRVAE